MTGKSLSASLSAGVSLRPTASRPARSSPLDIVIPIYNNAERFRLCLDSLLPTLNEGDHVWLIDDASDEPEIAEMISEFSNKWLTTHPIRNFENRGFVGTANLAFDLTSSNIVLLNSDTEVTAGWLEYLQACLQRNPRAGIVCPLSDHATILSVLPTADTSGQVRIASNAAATTSGDIPLPTAVGFCMLIRRTLIDQIGGFSQVFAPGYGEENDLSMRALRAGWDILAADQACVFHHSGGSFGVERSNRLQASHQAILDRIWPEYSPLVQSWWRDNPLRAKTERLARPEDGREAVLHVLHRQYHVGGTERVARTLIRELRDSYRQTLLYTGETASAWCDFEWRSNEPCRELMLNSRWIRPRVRIAGHGADLACPQAERALARVIHGSGARLVHFHHMLQWDSLLLPAVARALGCHVVISVHDFWFNCPVYNQLEHSNGQPCGRSHAHSDERCVKCLQGWGLYSNAPSSRSAAYIQGRYGLIQEMLKNADAVLVPSQFIWDRLLKAYPGIPDGTVRVEPQGVPLPNSLAAPSGSETRVLGYFGGDHPLKGANLVLHLAKSLQGSKVIFRVFGRIKGFDPASLPSNVELKGFYNPDEVSQVMEGVDLALLPSHFEESYSMIASECWAHGVPVLSSARGAMTERVSDGINGWLVQDMSLETWLRALRRVLEGDTIERCRKRLSGHEVTSIEQSARAHLRLYQDLLKKPSLPVTAVAPTEPTPLFQKKLASFRGERAGIKKPAGIHCLGIVRDHWGTANYRVRFPLEDLASSGACNSSQFHVVRDAGFNVDPILRKAGGGHILVQPYLMDEGLKLMELLHRETDFDITLVVDDLWTDLPPGNPVLTQLPGDIPERLRYAASLANTMVLTTEEQQRRLGVPHDNTHVINNGLPEWIWGSLYKGPARPGKRLRLGWTGAPQHAGDLIFLERVMRETADLADWVFLGICPDALRPLASEVHDMVPFEQYPSALSALELDLGIAPLADHAFNRCKSHLKVLEYGILGIPVVATDLEPYRHCPVSLASPDDAADWIARLRALLEDRDARIEQGLALRDWVLNNHMTIHRRSDWERALGIDSNVA
ncbi:glycosyltransferase [Pseudomonadota bacterium]